MKKLKLKMGALKAEVLTREQLKAVMGGVQGSTGGCTRTCKMGCDDGCRCSSDDAMGVCVAE